MEAYKVWATLNLKGDALKKMEQFSKMTKIVAKELSKLNKIASSSSFFNKFNKSLSESESSLSSVAKQMKSLGSSLDMVSNKSKRAAFNYGKFKKSLHIAGHIGLSSVSGELGAISAAGMMGGGVAAGLIGAGILGYQGFQKQRSYQQSISQLEAQGFTKYDIAEVNRISQGTSPGISQLDIVQSLVDAQMATRNFEQAKYLAPKLAQAKVYSNVLYGGMSENEIKDLIRTAELAGGSKKENMAQWLDVATKMMVTSGGTIKPHEQRTFWRQSGGAMGRLTPLGYLSMEPIMQELGGAKLGTALTTGIRAFINPQMSNFAKYRVEKLKGFGLWNTKTGRMKDEFVDLAQTDPFMFLKNVWLPALAKKGITSPGKIQTETLSDLPRTFGQMLFLMFKNMEKMERSRELAQSAMGGDQLKTLAEKKPEFAVMRLSKAWESLTTVIGEMTTPSILEGLNALSSGLEKLGNVLSVFHNLTSFFSYLSGTKMRQSEFNETLFSGGNIIKPQEITLFSTVNVSGTTLAKIVAKNMGNAIGTVNQTGTSQVNPLYPLFPGVGSGLIGQN